MEGSRKSCLSRQHEGEYHMSIPAVKRFLAGRVTMGLGVQRFLYSHASKCRRILYAPGCEASPVVYGPCEGGFMSFIRSAEERICPRCHGNWIRRSHRRGKIEKMACKLLLISPFRCEDCGHRYYRFRSASPTREHRTA